MSKDKIRKVALLVLSCLAVTGVSAQNDIMMSKAPQCCIASPNTVSIARYGDIPMDYYTGRANITIPIYHTTERGVTLNVSLSYDTQGILAGSLPSWTGYNWTLHAGGVITRVRNGMVDEFEYSKLSHWENYFQSPGKLLQYVNQYNADKSIAALCKHIREDKYDCDPDVFYFNFMGKSGRFFYGQDGEWKVMSDDNIHVVFDVNDPDNYILPYFKYYNQTNKNRQRKTIKGFTLIDEDGTRYVFGDHSSSTTETSGLYETRASAIEYSQPFLTALRNNNSDTYGVNESMTASAWYLTEVRDRFGNVLYHFEYERGKFMVQASYMHEEKWIIYGGNSVSPHSNIWDTFHYALCLNSPVYLSRITMPMSNHSVSFTRDSSRVLSAGDFYPSFRHNLETLKRLSTYDNSPEMFYFLHGTDKYVADYQNTNGDKTNNPLASMGMSPLKNITVSFNGKKIEGYDFTYTTGNVRLLLTGVAVTNGGERKGRYNFTYNNPGKIPQDCLTTKTDDWGFFNDSEGDRTPNTTATQYGMLTKISYPTGGVTEITYGQNSYKDYYDRGNGRMQYDPGTTGGLVVKSLKDYDAPNGKLLSSRTFTYSDGQLYALPKYEWDWKPASSGLFLHLEDFNSIVPLCNSFGSHIGYSTVRETYADGSYTQYKYRNIDAGMDEKPVISASSSPSPYDVYSDCGFMRGRISSVEHYDNRGHAMSTITYYYRTDHVKDKFVYGNNLRQEQGYPNAPGGYYVGGVYKMYYPKYDVVKTYSTTRYEETMVGEQTDYEKEDVTIDMGGCSAEVRKCLSETVKRGSSTAKTVYGYPYQDMGQSKISKRLVSQFYLPVTSVKRYQGGMLTGGRKTVYGECQSNYVPMYDIVYASSPNACDTIARYESYSSTFRPVEVTDVNNVRHMFFWNSHDQLAATVANGSVNIRSNPTATDSKSVIASSQAAEVFGTMPTDITACVYNGRGLVHSITRGNGQTAYYGYDTFGSLVSVSDLNKKAVQRYNYSYRTTFNKAAGPVSDTAVKTGCDDSCYPVYDEAHAPSLMTTGGISCFSYDPNKKTATVDYAYSNATSASIKVISDSGTCVSATDLPAGNGKGHRTISLSSLTAGYYEVCLYVNGTRKDPKGIYILH